MQELNVCYSILYYTILYYTILYYTILYYTIVFQYVHVACLTEAPHRTAAQPDHKAIAGPTAQATSTHGSRILHDVYGSSRDVHSLESWSTAIFWWVLSDNHFDYFHKLALLLHTIPHSNNKDLDKSICAIIKMRLCLS